MREIKNNDVNKFLYYVLSNEKQSLKDNPFRDESEKHKLKKKIHAYLEEQSKQIIGRD